ncbi:hypothetical protein MGG_06280 [Pyricularia oryzae 70-15]|uniref:Uncharacterized protein n=2 Tax=Pyricularia oryzae TaxID=318829 RepID=G4N8E2_PYRO7|nr:uncharacterized protein MGG_06280 [Pyricularia oryzae 70-15]EHA50989.1 hypothetical protein MGG_06280 [Pyricularia oryzae 70-15]ELQ40764.1 hypothetical protein OOU_Y34scaffold00363g4 [Pyricularia oryzae Y34]
MGQCSTVTNTFKGYSTLSRSAGPKVGHKLAALATLRGAVLLKRACRGFLVWLAAMLARQGKARQGKARQGKARQGKARQGKARQGKARQGKARQGKARQGKARQVKCLV